MNKQAARRLVLAGCFLLAAVLPAPAQAYRPPQPGHPYAPPPMPEIIIPDASPHPSHRPLDIPIGDLKDAESSLSERLKKSENREALKALLMDGLADAAVRKMVKDRLKDQFKGDDPEAVNKQLDQLLDMVKDNPQLLDDPAVQGMLNDPKFQDLFKDVKGAKDAQDLPEDKKKQLADIAKGFLENKIKPQEPDPAHGPTGGPPDQVGPLPPKPTPVTPPRPTAPPPPPADSKPSWISREMIDGVSGLIKDMDKSGDGESLRTALREIAKMDAGPSGSSDPSGFLKGLLSPDDAGWLSHNLRLPSPPDFSGWSPPSASAGLGAAADGLPDVLLWAVALALLVAAGWFVWSMARRQAAAARGRPWSAGPWPVDPSQVATREDLVRAFEHLAYLLLGASARPLNHVDVASRLGEKDGGRHGAAARLGRLYEQARYAPPQEALPPDELAAARGDLAALAGAAA
jgi:hypothetical protein